MTDKLLEEQMARLGGVPAETATAAMLLARFATLWFAVAVGFIALGILRATAGRGSTVRSAPIQATPTRESVDKPRRNVRPRLSFNDGGALASPSNASLEQGMANSLIQRVIAHLRSDPRARAWWARATMALDKLESKLMVELPPSLRTFLQWDFTFESLGPKFHGKRRFGKDPEAPRPRMTSVRKLAEARTELGWTDSRIKGKVVRLPNLPGHRWNALYLGEARRDGELVILGIDNEDTLVRVYPRYTAFDLYLAEQSGLHALNESQRLDDLESHIAMNPELAGSSDEEEEIDQDY